MSVGQTSARNGMDAVFGFEPATAAVVDVFGGTAGANGERVSAADGTRVVGISRSVVKEFVAVFGLMLRTQLLDGLHDFGDVVTLPVGG